MEGSEFHARGVFVLFLVGVAGVAGFVYTELFLHRTVCPLCIATHLSGLAILALSAAILRSRYAPLSTTKRALGHGRGANEAGRWRVYATGVRLELDELKTEVAQLKSLEIRIGRILGEDTAEPGLQLWVNQ